MVRLQYPAASGTSSGISRYSLELASALERAGEPVRRWPVGRVEVRVGSRGFGGLMSLRLQLALPVRKRGDLLHSTHLYSGHPAADVATVHDCFPETYREELGRTRTEDGILARMLARYRAHGTRLVAPSAATRDTFLSLHPEFPADHLHVTHLGIGGEFAPAPAGQERHPSFRDGALNVLCVADLNPRKRVDWLLEAAAGLDRPVRVVQVGSRKQERPAWRLQAQREQPWVERLGDRLVRPGAGAVGHDDLVRLYQGADVLVLPSLDEGFGFPPLEAMRCGTPVLLADRPVFRELFGARASYFQGVPDLAEALERATPPTAAQRKENHRWVAQTYTWDRTARATMQVYETLRKRG